MNEEDAKQELTQEWEAFPNPEDVPDFLQSCAKISAALSQGPKSSEIKQGLQSLENAMFEEIMSRLNPEILQKQGRPPQKQFCIKLVKDGAFDPKEGNRKPQLEGEEHPQDRLKEITSEDYAKQGRHIFSKLLTNVLFRYEESAAFKASKDDHFHPIYYLTKVSPERFLKNIALGYHWKDVGVPGRHGEFTHRVQWYVLGKGGVIPEHQIAAVYREIGKFTTPAEQMDRLGQNALWARVCDRVEGEGHASPENTTDFRCPEFLMDYLTKSAKDEYPLLGGFLSARLNKRTGEVAAVEDSGYEGRKKAKYENPLFF